MMKKINIYKWGNILYLFLTIIGIQIYIGYLSTLSISQRSDYRSLTGMEAILIVLYLLGYFFKKYYTYLEQGPLEKKLSQNCILLEAKRIVLNSIYILFSSNMFSTIIPDQYYMYKVTVKGVWMIVSSLYFRRVISKDLQRHFTENLNHK